MQKKYLISFAFPQSALHKKVSKQAIFCCGNGWRKKLLCFENASKELVAILVLPSSVSVCMAAPSYYGDRQVARSWRGTVHCSAAARPAICLCNPPIAGEDLRCYYSGPLFFFCRTFLAGTCKWFLICMTWRFTPCVEKNDFALEMCTVAYEPYQKTRWSLILNVK